MNTLRDGSITLDPRLDAIFDKDPRNRDFPATMALPQAVQHVSKAWGVGPVTDQGAEGACVGHACLGGVMAEPISHEVTDHDPNYEAFELYHEIQDNDDWPGCSRSCTPSESYSGTSLKAGGKQLVARGLIREFRWNFGLDDTLAWLATKGPVLLAIPWFESMYSAVNGVVVIGGRQVGRHAIMVPQVDFENRQVEWQNSWGLAYGRNGRARLSFETLDQLLKDEGESMALVL